MSLETQNRLLRFSAFFSIVKARWIIKGLVQSLIIVHCQIISEYIQQKYLIAALYVVELLIQRILQNTCGLVAGDLFCLLGYNTVLSIENQLTIQRNMSLSYSRLKSEPTKKPARRRQ